MLTKRHVVVLAVLLASILLAAACGGSSSPLVVEKEVVVEKPVVQTVVVEKEVVVEKPIVQTVLVEKRAEEKGCLSVVVLFATHHTEPWDQAIWQAVGRAKSEGLVCDPVVMRDGLGYEGKLEAEARAVAEELKPDVILGDAFGNESAIRRVARDYPGIAFAFGSGEGHAPPNFSVFDNWLHEIAESAGLLAGGMTQSGKIGVVAGKPVPEVNRIVNAFVHGVKEVNPKATVYVSFIDSWFDPPKAKETALAQVDGGADVIFAERDGAIEAAKERGVWAIGMMLDQHADAPERVVTSLVWDVYPIVNQVLKQVQAGIVPAVDLKDYSMVAYGGAALAPYYNLEGQIPQGVRELVRQRHQEILAGLHRVVVDESVPPPVN